MQKQAEKKKETEDENNLITTIKETLFEESNLCKTGKRSRQAQRIGLQIQPPKTGA